MRDHWHVSCLWLVREDSLNDLYNKQHHLSCQLLFVALCCSWWLTQTRALVTLSEYSKTRALIVGIHRMTLFLVPIGATTGLLLCLLVYRVLRMHMIYVDCLDIPSLIFFGTEFAQNNDVIWKMIENFSKHMYLKSLRNVAKAFIAIRSWQQLEILLLLNLIFISHLFLTRPIFQVLFTSVCIMIKCV